MKKINLLLLCFVFALSFIPLAMAANASQIITLTIDRPIAAESIRGNFNFTFSYTGNASANTSQTFQQAVAFYNDTSLTTQICNVTGLAIEGMTYGCFNTTQSYPDDCSGHTIIATFTNGTDKHVVNDTNTGVIFDNTNATFTRFTADFDKVKIHKPISYAVTGATDACDSSPTTFTTLTKPDSTTVSKNGTVNTWSLSDVNLLGTYTAAVFVVDNAGGQATSTLTFDVIGSGSSQDALEVQATVRERNAGVSSSALLVIIGGAVVLLICLAGIGFLLYNKGKR